jgi:hypothetical protein
VLRGYRMTGGKKCLFEMKLVEAWIKIHKEDLLANWELAVNGQAVFKIEPLK